MSWLKIRSVPPAIPRRACTVAVAAATCWSLIGSHGIRTEALDCCFDAFSSREPVSTSLENAIECGPKPREADRLETLERMLKADTAQEAVAAEGH